MLELGNKCNGKGVYKDYFVQEGIDHISIDWNGENGALKLDLREPIDLPVFDMITNIGTTEHVSDQTAVWANIHHLLKVDGILVCVTPYPGDWSWHGNYYPTENFYRDFADLNGYKIEKLYIGRERPNRNWYGRFRKLVDADFIMPDGIYINKL